MKAITVFYGHNCDNTLYYDLHHQLDIIEWLRGANNPANDKFQQMHGAVGQRIRGRNRFD